MLVFSSGSVENGAARSLLNLARYAIGAGHRVVVLIAHPGSFEAELQRLGIPYRLVRHLVKWVVPLDSAYPSGIVQRAKRLIRIGYDRIVADARVRRILDEYQIDVVHINMATTCAAARPALQKKKKLVWHIREILGEGLRQRLVDPDGAFRLMSRADCVVAISDAVHREYAGRISTRMLRIYNGVDPRVFYADREPFRSETARIVISGRIVPEKGHLTLLKALAIARREGADSFECHVLGPRSDRGYADELAEYAAANGLEGCVHFEGRSERVPQWLRRMDILCLCSAREAFGLSTVEGMLSGCLVVGTNAGGTAEILEDGVTGLLYEPGDGEADALARRLIWAMRNPEAAREIALRGQRHALDHFNSENTQKRILRLYEELLS